MSWKQLKIRDVTAKVGSGATPRGGEPAYKSVGVPLIRSMNVHFNGFRRKGLAFLDEQQAGELDGATVKANDVLLNITGASIGRVATAPSDLDGARVNQHVCIIRPLPILSSTFLAYFLSSPDQQSKIMREQVGATRQGLTKVRILEFDVPVPTEIEQQRIVAKIEELFSDLDAGVAALERVRANLKRYRASVLNAAVTGKLTEDWRTQNSSVEPTEKLLLRIRSEQQNRWKASQNLKFSEASKSPPKDWTNRYQTPRSVLDAGLKAIPKTWAWATFEQVTHEVTVGHVGPMKGRYVNQGISFLRSQNVRPLRFDPLGLQYIPVDFDADLKKSRLLGGELLVVRSGVNVGDACVFPNTMAPANCSDLVISRPTSLFMAQYGSIFIMSPTGQAALRLLRTGNAQPHFNIGAMKQTPFPLPPFEEQGQIVAEVERRLSVADAVESEINRVLARSSKLRQAILKHAFEGKLVPQIEGEFLPSLPRQHPPLATSPRARTKRIPPPPRTKRRHRKGIAFDRCAVMSYAINRLCSGKHFGRTEAMKTLYLSEAWLGIDLELEPVREQMGPLDNAIYKIENLARKQGWFTTRRAGPMIRYEVGPEIADRLAAGKRILGDKLTEFDRLLSAIEKMDTDRAELFATTFAVWNDLLLDSKPVDDATIIKGIHGWHPSKAGKFPGDRIEICISWMKQQGFVPRGTGPRSTLLSG